MHITSWWSHPFSVRHDLPKQREKTLFLWNFMHQNYSLVFAFLHLSVEAFHRDSLNRPPYNFSVNQIVFSCLVLYVYWLPLMGPFTPALPGWIFQIWKNTREQKEMIKWHLLWQEMISSYFFILQFKQQKKYLKSFFFKHIYFYLLRNIFGNIFVKYFCQAVSIQLPISESIADVWSCC